MSKFPILILLIFLYSLCHQCNAQISVVPGQSKCSAGWSEFNGSCYKVIIPRTPTGMNFEQANSACKAESSELASVHSDAENKFIYNQVRRAAQGTNKFYYFYLGLKSPGVSWKKKKHGWTDGTPVDYADPATTPIARYPWSVREPSFGDHPNEFCTSLIGFTNSSSPNGWIKAEHWNDVACSLSIWQGNKFGTICKKKAV